MSNGFGPLLRTPSLNQIHYRERECPFRERDVLLSQSWSSLESWVNIDGVGTDDQLSMPMHIATQIGARILYADLHEGDLDLVLDGNLDLVFDEPFTGVDPNDLAAFIRVLRHIIKDTK